MDLDADLNVDVNADLNAHTDALYAEAGFPVDQSLYELESMSLAPVETNLQPSELSQVYYPTEGYQYALNQTNFSSFPVEQSCTYAEPQGYYSAHETPFFDNQYSAIVPLGDMFSTLGLAAIPSNTVFPEYGNTAFAEYGDVQYPLHPYAYPTGSWMQPTEATSFPTVNNGYVPVAPSFYNGTTNQFAPYLVEKSQAVMTTQAPTVGPVTSSETGDHGPPYTEEHTDPEAQESNSDSDSDYHDIPTEPTKASKRAARKRPRNDSCSSASTPTATPFEPVKYILGEKPKKVDSKPWIRTNASTEGDTRTAKINNWINKYEYKPLPLGTWSSGKYTFKYTQYANVDFLTEGLMSTRKIKEYIMNYPREQSDTSRSLDSKEIG